MLAYVILVAIVALIVAAFVYIPRAIANIKPRIPQSLQSRGIDTPEEYIKYLEANKR